MSDPTKQDAEQIIRWLQIATVYYRMHKGIGETLFKTSSHPMPIIGSGTPNNAVLNYKETYMALEQLTNELLEEDSEHARNIWTVAAFALPDLKRDGSTYQGPLDTYVVHIATRFGWWRNP